MTSFVYRWTDTLTGMMYIGVHKGLPDDGYICSSKVMLPIYHERPDTFIREIMSEWQRGKPKGPMAEETKQKLREKALARMNHGR